MATITPEGRPHVVPFVFVLIGEDPDLHAYWVVDRKQKRSRFLLTVERRPKRGLVFRLFLPESNEEMAQENAGA
jgi:hypothetical protein